MMRRALLFPKAVCWCRWRKVKNWLLFASNHKHSKRLKKIRVQRDEIPSSGLNKEANALLKAAQEQIDAKIAELMASYPPGKKNKLFTLRYGSPESIKQMAMKAIFTRLGLVKPKKFALIENLDYFGNGKMKQ